MFKLKLQLYRHTLLSHVEKFYSPKFCHFKTPSRKHPVDLQRIWYEKCLYVSVKTGASSISCWLILSNSSSNSLCSYPESDSTKRVNETQPLPKAEESTKCKYPSNATNLKSKVSHCVHPTKTKIMHLKIYCPFQKGDSEVENHCF